MMENIFRMDVKQKPYSDPKRWTCIYPAYIDSKKSAAEGRRIRKDKVSENRLKI